MDARTARTRARLRASVLALADRTPLAELTVAEVCADADVVRDTFYRHASDVQALLADALGAEIDAHIAELGSRAGMEAAERALLEHVAERARVYRGAMRPTLAPAVRATLEDEIRRGLREWIRLHPEIDAPGAVDDFDREIAVAYAAGGTVAAIELWLRVDGEDVASATRAILAATPEWWLR
ncbi:hypothetical protein [Agromyces seonyuensis]|uniref:HTH tetR-type domain-containing protein n=1 Tax=Agromyces seonyuensis TaxID=2662446 RepID=A0A6I4NVT6_9MICO|nr:hypothetical protein [Agromyces seonyuensis]MWB98508.1 hypothetical protein [Agromyces seonyuensis]